MPSSAEDATDKRDIVKPILENAGEDRSRPEPLGTGAALNGTFWGQEGLVFPWMAKSWWVSARGGWRMQHPAGAGRGWVRAPKDGQEGFPAALMSFPWRLRTAGCSGTPTKAPLTPGAAPAFHGPTKWGEKPSRRCCLGVQHPQAVLPTRIGVPGLLFPTPLFESAVPADVGFSFHLNHLTRLGSTMEL